MSLNNSIGRRVSGPSATFSLQHYGKHFESGRHRQKRRETAAKSLLVTLKHLGDVENHKMENSYRKSDMVAVMAAATKMTNRDDKRRSSSSIIADQPVPPIKALKKYQSMYRAHTAKLASWKSHNNDDRDHLGQHKIEFEHTGQHSVLKRLYAYFMLLFLLFFASFFL
jgi:hypothetical protein